MVVLDTLIGEVAHGSFVLSSLMCMYRTKTVAVSFKIKSINCKQLFYLVQIYACILEKEMATHSSVLAWRIPGTGKPGGLPSMGSHRVRHY